jgi:hypothetical protein
VLTAVVSVLAVLAFSAGEQAPSSAKVTARARVDLFNFIITSSITWLRSIFFHIVRVRGMVIFLKKITTCCCCLTSCLWCCKVYKNKKL